MTAFFPHREQQENPNEDEDDSDGDARARPPPLSAWILRFKPVIEGESDQGTTRSGRMRRSRSCSSVLLPEFSIKRPQHEECHEPLEDWLLHRHSISSPSFSQDPAKKSRSNSSSLSRSLDRSSFLLAPNSSAREAPRRIIRGFVAATDSQEPQDSLCGFLKANAPLPYSSYQGSNPRDKQGLDPAKGLASLLTESSTNRHQEQSQHELHQQSGSNQENFVHPESVLTRPLYTKRQSIRKEGSWINRWSDENLASVSGLGYVPSAAAMAIISKSYTSSLTTPSWSNSIEAWQSDADSKDARRW
ncbi:uncharacterized protein LOC112348799 isoform X2 [Selaginella moellendorffii]|uniref:uncharacterized protein LOC112348799 isoform X2 n=1 Tax=Selaginella moellendorffii TaxID=88036 RepID=UPI000D1C7AED|nr:uncharacterized protein LOC112348799 isoform X2 [Selaginella moellendorffii]|eukprot:XP_024537783.1 uncharacterized protein LOC112348799 isoform X2 [Selaginella moellendorffii]